MNMICMFDVPRYVFGSTRSQRLFLKFRVENLEKFKNEEDDCPTLVCTDLAARGLDLDVDHVIMFDFPLNSVSTFSSCPHSLFALGN